MRASIAAAVTMVVASQAAVVQPATRSDHFGRAGLRGSGIASMHTVATPARIGRVAYDPSSGEFWAVGLTLAQSAARGWDARSPGGQLVFLRLAGGRWRVEGPPVRADGTAFNPQLYALALAGGEGWAVGEGGVVLHKSRGSSRWVADDAATEAAARARLTSVSVRRTPAGTAGYAVGIRGTILRLSSGQWTRESVPTITEDLGSVSVVSADVAWAAGAPSANDVTVWQRSSAGWTRLTIDPAFAGPHPTQTGTGVVIDRASATSIAADAGGAWVGGLMFPRDAAHLFGDATPGDTSRPFMLRITGSGATVSYCPDAYGVRREAGGMTLDTRAVCANAFPLSAFDITAITLLPGGEAFASGLGLYRFRAGGWSREPDAVGYISSLALRSASEGWVATSGSTYGAGLAIHSSESLLGHWTNKPERPRLARWPQPQQQPLHDAAIAPDGSGRVLAVGEQGAVVSYLPEVGWDYLSRVTESAVHSVAWADANTAWAVGEQGLIQRFDGVSWRDVSPPGVRAGLFGVAFDGPDRGVAVGMLGTVLVYDGTRWRAHRQSGLVPQALYDVAFSPDGNFVAVGEDGVVVESAGASLRVDRSASGVLNRRRPGAGTLYAVTVGSDGTVFTGGSRSALLARAPGGAFRADPIPPEGTIVALAVAGGRTFASVSPDVAKFRGDRMGVTRTAVMMREAGVWRDVSMWRRRPVYPGFESSRYDDPVYAIALEGSGRTGWAVGGFPASTPDADGHLREEPTSSVYRLNLDDDPAPAFAVPDIVLPSDGLSFAFFAESWCGLGMCSNAMGIGTQADEVAEEIQNQVGVLAGRPGGPRFVLFGGNLRSTGIPEELAQARAYIAAFRVPLFAALGDRDLFAALSGTVIGKPPEALSALSAQTAGVPEYWMEEFVAMPAPWGSGRPPANIVPVEVASEAPPRPGKARTHYAFDYVRGSEALLRVIVLDTSTRSFGRADGSDQNPPDRQDHWLESVFVDARLENDRRGVPTIILMNQPTNVPDVTPQPNWNGNPADAGVFQNVVVGNNVSGVFTGGLRSNVRDGYPSADAPVVPVWVGGGGGAPVGYEKPNQAARAPSKLPSDGYYNAWHLVTARPVAGGTAPRVALSVRTFPVLDSVALRAHDGRIVGAGSFLHFSALARSLSGGDSDPEQSRSTYFELGTTMLPRCPGHGQGFGGCTSRDAIIPPYRFYSEDPEIADFVVPDFGGVEPKKDRVTNRVIKEADGVSGLLCAFKAGSTYVNVESGFRRARMKVTVGAGFGPCVERPVIIEPEVERPPVFPPSEAEPAPRPYFRPPQQQAAVALFPPPPAPVIAPAPPGAPGAGKKEEHEVETEQQGADKPHAFTALEPQRARTGAVRGQWLPRRRAPDPIESAWPILGGTIALAWMFATILASRRQHRPSPERIRAR